MPPVIGTASWTDAWFVINRVLDGIFLLDMCLQFFVAYQTGNDFGGRTWVVDPRQIMHHYLCGFFALDSFTVLVPGGFDLYLASPTFDSSSGTDEVGVEGKLGVLRMLRVSPQTRSLSTPTGTDTP